MKEHSYALLENAPPHDSPAFIDYIRNNNAVVEEDDNYIVIENCKYHTPEKPWYTAFQKSASDHIEPYELLKILDKYWEWEWLKKRKSHQTINRFHIHLIK